MLTLGAPTPHSRGTSGHFLEETHLEVLSTRPQCDLVGRGSHLGSPTLVALVWGTDAPVSAQFLGISDVTAGGVRGPALAESLG